MNKHRPGFDTVENFRDCVEAVEVARDFLIANTPQKVRLALITLDNAAELLMTRMCRGIFEHDEFLAKIRQPRFCRKFKKRTLWEFGAKTELMKAEGIMSDSDAGLLNLGHEYRNPAFHQGRHNPRSVRTLSIMLLTPIATLRQKTFKGAIGGVREIAWLRDYGVATAPLCFEEAAAKIMTQLADSLRQSLECVREALSEDVTNRLNDLDRLLHDERYALKTEQWDDALKHAQFVEAFDDEAASAAYRQLAHRITERTKGMSVDEICQLGPNDPVSCEEFRRTETEYKARYAQALKAFTPAFGISELEQLRQDVPRLNEAAVDTALILAYRNLDQRLTKAEELISAARVLIEESIQLAIDLDRGK
jgi:hypothetical protein